jgi:hypothetical protein
MICTDCKKEDGIEVRTDFDFNQMADICPRCGRVYSPLFSDGLKHYATKEAAMAAMARDQKEKPLIHSTRAFINRVLGDRF